MLLALDALSCTLQNARDELRKEPAANTDGKEKRKATHSRTGNTQQFLKQEHKKDNLRNASLRLCRILRAKPKACE